VLIARGDAGDALDRLVQLLAEQDSQRSASLGPPTPWTGVSAPKTAP